MIFFVLFGGCSGGNDGDWRGEQNKNILLDMQHENISLKLIFCYHFFACYFVSISIYYRISAKFTIVFVFTNLLQTERGFFSRKFATSQQ